MRHTKDRFIFKKGALSLSLDYGVDEDECPREAVQVVQQGMYFQSRWRFAPCTELQLTITVPAGRRSMRRYLVSGLVAGCDKISRDCFRTTLHFMGSPREVAGWMSATRRLALG